MQPTTRTIWTTLSLCAALAACDANGSDDAEAGDAVADQGTMSRACIDEARDDFAIGVERQGASLSVSIADAMPSDPIRGDNGWTLRVSQGAVPMDDVAIEVKPWMPDHGHGTPVAASIEADGDGQYTIAPLNLFMAGLWEITFVITLADGSTDEVMFSACVE